MVAYFKRPIIKPIGKMAALSEGYSAAFHAGQISSDIGVADNPHVPSGGNVKDTGPEDTGSTSTTPGSGHVVANATFGPADANTNSALPAPVGRTPRLGEYLRRFIKSADKLTGRDINILSPTSL